MKRQFVKEHLAPVFNDKGNKVIDECVITDSLSTDFPPIEETSQEDEDDEGIYGYSDAFQETSIYSKGKLNNNSKYLIEGNKANVSKDYAKRSNSYSSNKVAPIAEVKRTVFYGSSYTSGESANRA